jgi:hypothetical protein
MVFHKSNLYYIISIAYMQKHEKPNSWCKRYGGYASTTFEGGKPLHSHHKHKISSSVLLMRYVFQTQVRANAEDRNE